MIQRYFSNYPILKKKNYCKLKYTSIGTIRNVMQLKRCYGNCEQGEYKCKISNYCITIKEICDGISHCPLSDDENGCGNIYFPFSFFLFTIKIN